MDPIFNQVYLPNAAASPKLNPSFSQVMTSAFRLENDVVNMLDYLSRPTFQPEEGFNFQSVFKERNLPIEWMPMLAGTQSRQEFDFKVGKMQKEYKDKAVLAASGWGGTVAAISSGMLSPTVFIPFAGQARGGLAFAEVLGLAAVGAGAQNGALFLNQETRTEAELYTGIALDTLLGGMLGGAWLGLSREGRARLAAEVVDNQNYVSVPSGPKDNPTFVSEKVLVTEPRLTVDDLPFVGKNINGVPEAEAVASPLAKAEYPYDLIVPLRQAEKEPLIQAINTAYSAATSVRLPIRQLTTDVGAIGKNRVQTPGSEPVLVEKIGDVYYLRDGNHRAAAAFMRGDESIEATVVDMNPVLQSFGREVPEVKVEPGMVRSPGDTPIPISSRAVDAEPVGAQVARTRNTLGAQAAPNRISQAAMNALGRLSPSYRMLTQRTFASLRDAAAKLDMSGIRQAGLNEVEASAKAGTVIERIRGYDPYIVEFAQTIDRNYYRYIHGTDSGFDFGSPAITQMKAFFGNVPPGKMNWDQYKEAMFDALNTGEITSELADSVSAFKKFFENYTTRQNQYLEEMRAEGLEVEPLFEELMSDELGKGIENYAHHIFSKQKLMDKMSEFLDDFSKYNESQLVESFTRAQARYRKRQNNLAFERDIAGMDQAAITKKLEEVESDLEFLEELPIWQDFRQARLDLNRQARDEGWSKETLKEWQEDLKKNMSEDLKLLQEDRKLLMAQAKAYRKFGGDAAEKTEKLKAEIDKVDGLIDDMFRTELPGIERADLSIGRLQKESDKAFSDVQKGLDKIVKSMAKRRARYSTLLNSKRNNTASRQKVMAQLEQDRLKHEDLLYRLETVKGQQIARDVALRELQTIREIVIMDATRLVRKRAAKLEDLEDRLEAVQAKVIEPEERARMKAQIEDLIDLNERKFQMDWSAKGERSGDPVNTMQPDFKEASLEAAVMLHQKLMGTEVELSPAYRALRQDARGAALLRVMKIPYEIKQKYLEKDVELVSRAYDRTMAPDLELWRAFDGSVNGKSVLTQMQEEATEQLTRISTMKYVKLPKGWTDKSSAFSARVKKRITEFGEADDIFIDGKNFSNEPGKGFVELTPELRDQLSRSVHDSIEASTRDFDVAIQRLRATRGVPDDPGSIMWRTGRFVKNLNVMTMMGGVVTSSLSDVARPVWRHGVSRVFQHGWGPFVKGVREGEQNFRLRSKEINQKIGLNLEPVLHSRAQGLFDLGDDVVGKSRIERAANVGANKMGLIALYDYWTAGMKTIAGNVFHATMAEYVPAVAKAIQESTAAINTGTVKNPVWKDNPSAELTGDLLEMRTKLRNLGWSDNTILRIAQQMEKPNGVETFSNGGVLPNLDAWDDMAAYQAYQAGALKEVNELIVTPGLERPNWTDENMAYSLVAQFKSFVFSSTSRMAMSGLQGNDPYLMQGVAFSLAFGALSYYTYAITVGGKTLEEANKMEPDKFLWEAVKRSGLLGALSIGTDAASNIPGAYGESPNIFTRSSGLLGVALGPTYSQMEKMAGVLTQFNTDDERQQERNLTSLRQIFVPFQNHFIFRQAFDAVGDAMTGG